MTKLRVGVVGLGLIGGSVAAALRQSGALVAGHDIEPAVRQTAVARQLVDSMSGSLAEVVSTSDVVILSTPPSATIDVLGDVDRFAKASAIIMDTASVKGPIIAAMERQTGAYRMVGGHPLAGSERSGPDTARVDLFDSNQFALVRNRHTRSETLMVATSVVQRLGARPVYASAEGHDATVARTSHVVQLASYALAAGLQPGDAQLAGPGVRGMTRLAAASPDLWLEILELNRTEVVRACKQFGSVFEQISSAIESENTDALREIFGSSRDRALALRGNSG